jgi:hypothetical protein
VANGLTIQAEIANDKVVSDMASQPLAQEQPKNPTSDSQISANGDLSLSLDIPLANIEDAKAIGDNNLDATARSSASVNYPVAAQANDAYEAGIPVDEASTIVAQRLAKEADMSASEFVLMQGLALTRQDVNPEAARGMTNMAIWDKKMADAIDQNEQGLFSKILTFVDVNVLREMTIGIVDNTTFRSNREGEDIKQAFLNKTPAEFETWATTYINERKQEGFFSSDSIWNLYKVANDATYLGKDPFASANFTMGIMDLVGAGESVKGLTSGVRASVKNIRRGVDAIAVLADEPTAGAAMARQVEREGVQVDKVTAGRALDETSLDPIVNKPNERPSGVTYRDGTRKTVLMEKLEEINRQTHFGEYLPKTTLQRLAVEASDRITNSVSDVGLRLSTFIDEGSNDYKVALTFGKEGSGAAFPTKASAEAVAKVDPSFRVVKADGTDNLAKRGWYIQTDRRLDVLGVGDQAELVQKSNFVFDTINKIFEPTTARLGDRLGAKVMQAEAGLARVPELFKPYGKTIKALKPKEADKLSDFFSHLRDGDYSYMRHAPDETSFKALYHTRYGEAPSEKIVKAYPAVLDIHDTTWNIKASARLKSVVAEGGEVIELADGYTDIAYRVDGQSIRVPEDELVLDLVTNRSISRDKLKSDQLVYKVPDPYLDHIYVTNVRKARAPNKTDVMPYNVGGPRNNSVMRWFMGTTKEITLASGKKINSTFKTLLGAFGKDQIEGAVKEVNTISKAVKEFMSNQGVRKLDDLILTAKQADELNTIIQANNKWNPHITNVDELKRIGRQHNFNFTEEFVAKARDEKISIRDAGEDPSISSNSTYGEVVGTRVNMRRGDSVLMNYGGGRAANVNPINAIAEQFGMETFGYANRAATRDAVDGWIKLAEANEGLVKFPTGVAKSDYIGRLLGAEVTTSGRYKDVAAQLLEQQAILRRRLGQPTFTSRLWEGFTKNATEAIFGSTGIKLDLTKSDPASKLLQIGFYSKFGFFNPDQFILQALHTTVIVAASPVQGIKAVAMALPVQMLASLPDEASVALGIRRLVTAGLADETELTNIVRYIRESGRNIVDNQIVELQMPNKYGAASSLAGKARERAGQFLDFSTMFFAAGEKATRTTSMITAVLEHSAKRVGEDAFSPEGLRWIANREQDLTFRMTTTSKGAWAQGPMRVPTQWLSYSLNAMQVITTNRRFTAGEKLRMAAVLGPLWGMTGLGAGNMTGYVVEKLGYDPTDPEAVKIFNTVKYGMGDRIISELLGTETAYAQRVAPLSQPIDFVQNLFSGSFAEALGGPSGQIGGDIWGGLTRMFTSAYGERWYTFKEDLNFTLRNISTYDKYIKITELIETGNYLSRTHRQAAGTFEKGAERQGAVAAVAFGATPAPVQNWYDYNDIIYSANEDFKNIEADLLRRARAATNMMQSGDQEQMLQGAKLFNETTDILWASPLSNELKLATERKLVKGDQMIDIMANAIRLGKTYEAQIMEQQR